VAILILLPRATAGNRHIVVKRYLGILQKICQPEPHRTTVSPVIGHSRRKLNQGGHKCGSSAPHLPDLTHDSVIWGMG